jgi:hypothetical protein
MVLVERARYGARVVTIPVTPGSGVSGFERTKRLRVKSSATQTAGINTRRLVGSIRVGLRRLAEKGKERREDEKRKLS